MKGKSREFDTQYKFDWSRNSAISINYKLKIPVKREIKIEIKSREESRKLRLIFASYERRIRSDWVPVCIRSAYQHNLRLSFLVWEAESGDNIRHTVLSNANGLESPKSLASRIEHLLESASFSAISCVAFRVVLWTSAWLCALNLVFFMIFLNLFSFSSWMKSSSLHVNIAQWRTLEIVADLFFSWLLMHANLCIYEN